MKLIYILLLSFFLFGCASHQEKVFKEEFVSDLIDIPQDVSVYTEKIDAKRISTLEQYEKEYFRVWNLQKIDITLNSAMWAHNTYSVGTSYGENLQLLEQDFFDSMLENANYKDYASLNKKAVTLKLLNIRAFPTDKPLLLDPTKAGEGFPFDYLQNSSIAANKPLLVSHYSKDREWVFVESSFAYGWVKADSVAFVENKHAELWQKAQQILIVKEGIPIYSESGDFLFRSRIGMMFALISEDRDSYSVLTLKRGVDAEAFYVKSKLQKSMASNGILEFNAKNINKIVQELSLTNYGWGGLYAQRDCSSTLRDFYAPFGIWLPRNSYKQSMIGETIALEKVENSKKIELIKQNAQPFETLLYKQGHIVLYAGTLNDEIIVFQNVWGVKTKKEAVEGRFIVGKPVFSTLEIGSNLKDYDASASLLEKLKSLNKVTP